MGRLDRVEYKYYNYYNKFKGGLPVMIDKKMIVSFEVKEKTAKKLDKIINFLEGYSLLTEGIRGVRSNVLRLCVEDIYELFFDRIYFDEIINPNFKKKSNFYTIIKNIKMEKAFKNIDKNYKNMSEKERIEKIDMIYKKLN
ncbi:hypothetical protein ES705_32187 [subsurface metagenome]